MGQLFENFKLDGSGIVYDDSDENNEEVVEGLVIEEAGPDNNEQVPPQAARMVNYDQASGQDDPGAIQNARDCKLPFNQHDIRLWFSLIESKMQFAGLKNQ